MDTIPINTSASVNWLKSHRNNVFSVARCALSLLLVMNLFGSPGVARADGTEPTTGEKVLSILAAHVVGFGSGHAIRGEWATRGKYFTFSEATALGLMAAGTFGAFLFMDAHGKDVPPDAYFHTMRVLMFGGEGAFFVLRLVEIGDVWIRAFRQTSSSQRDDARLSFSVAPVVLASAEQNSLPGVSLGLHF